MKFIFEDIKYSNLEQICYGNNFGTHLIKTCKIGDKNFHLKYINQGELIGTASEDMQILVEYLSYKIYSLYKNITIPNDIHLIIDENNNKIILATETIEGKIGKHVDPVRLGKLLSAGVFVDIFLANWDQKPNNVIITPDGKAARIDPGASLTFRATGKRKGDAFNKHANELKTMLNPNIKGSGWFLQYSDMKEAANEFKSISWSIILSQINDTNKEINNLLIENNFTELMNQWKQEIIHITEVLEARYKTILNHINFIILNENKKMKNHKNLQEKIYFELIKESLLKENISFNRWYHISPKTNRTNILNEGLKINQIKNFSQASEDYMKEIYNNIKPIFLLQEELINQYYNPLKNDIYEVDLAGMDNFICGDIPSLIQSYGAYLEQDHIWFEEGSDPFDLAQQTNEYFFEDFIGLDAANTKECINLTRTCAIISNIDPKRIKLNK